MPFSVRPAALRKIKFIQLSSAQVPQLGEILVSVTTLFKFNFDNYIQNMKKIITIAFFALMGCGTEEKQSLKVINFDQVKERPADLKIEKVVLLETDTTELLGENVKVQYNEEGFFVMNRKGAKGIHHFSLSGQHLGMAAQIGEAPGQLPEIADFKLKGSSLLIISEMGNRIDLHKFSVNHQLETTTEIPHYAYSFQPLENGDLWFYGGYYIVSGDHRLFLTDGSGKLKSKLLPNEVRPMGEIGGHAFFQGNDRILVREPLKTTVWEISGDTLKEAYRFNFGSNTVPEEYWEQDLFEGFGKLMAKGFTDIFFMVESDRYFLADVVTQKGMDRSKSLFLRDKKSHNQYKIKVNQEELGHFNLPIGIAEDQIMFFAYAAYLVRNNENLDLSDEAKASLANLTEDSNPVILYAKIPE